MAFGRFRNLIPKKITFRRGGRPVKDLTGLPFGKLKVLTRLCLPRYGHIYWECQCECGKKKSFKSSQLLTGSVRSCGCTRKQRGAEVFLGTKRLTRQDVDEIRRRYSLGGVTQGELALEFGMSQVTIFNVVHRITHTGEPRKPKRRKLNIVES